VFLQNVVLVTAERMLIGKEFYARGPAMEKGLSLRRWFVRGCSSSSCSVNIFTEAKSSLISNHLTM